MGTDKVFDFIFIALVAFTIAVMGAYRMRYKIESKTVQRVIGVLTACLGIIYLCIFAYGLIHGVMAFHKLDS